MELHTRSTKLPLENVVLERLQAAGLGSLPGGGAEILVDRVRKDAHASGKVLTDDWLERESRLAPSSGGAARPP